MMKACKSRLTDAEKSVAATRVFAQLEQTEAFISADRILLYHSLPDELSTVEFIDRWAQRKQLFLPRVNGDELEILPYDRMQLQKGAFNIEEPMGENLVEVSAMELIVVPAVAYDRHGNRVGRGKGYYDRLLAEASAQKIGVGYDFQLLDEIEAENHDVKVDMIITDQRQITLRK